jgi:hypothetical protein
MTSESIPLPFPCLRFSFEGCKERIGIGVQLTQNLPGFPPRALLKLNPNLTIGGWISTRNLTNLETNLPVHKLGVSFQYVSIWLSGGQ